MNVVGISESVESGEKDSDLILEMKALKEKLINLEARMSVKIGQKADEPKGFNSLELDQVKKSLFYNFLKN